MYTPVRPPPQQVVRRSGYRAVAYTAMAIFLILAVFGVVYAILGYTRGGTILTEETSLIMGFNNFVIYYQNKTTVILNDLAGVVGVLDSSCNDNNSCTVDLLHFGSNIMHAHCTNRNKPNGILCADSCLAAEEGTCNQGQCKGQCKGYCPFNVRSDWIVGVFAPFSNSSYIGNGTTGCSIDKIQVRDLYTNHSITSDPIINLLLYNTSTGFHKYSYCLEHNCIYRVPIHDPKLFVLGTNNGTTFQPSGHSVGGDSNFDQTLWDNVCQSLLTTNSSTDNNCLVGKISALSSKLAEWNEPSQPISETHYSCVYTYKCASFTKIVPIESLVFVGKRK